MASPKLKTLTIKWRENSHFHYSIPRISSG